MRGWLKRLQRFVSKPACVQRLVSYIKKSESPQPLVVGCVLKFVKFWKV